VPRIERQGSEASARRRWSARRSLAAGVLAALAAGAPAPAGARAQDEDPRPREAKAACAAGQVDRGIALLAALFAETSDVSWVYNQGRCYQQNGRPEEAINRFREYLRRAAVSETEKRTEAQRFIEELEEELRRAPARAGIVVGSAHDVEPLPGDPPQPPPAPPGRDGVGDGAPSVRAPSGDDRPVSRRGLMVGGAALVGVGVLGLAGGIFSSLRVKALEDETRGWSAAEWKRRAATQENTAGRYERWQWVGYGVAALALAGGGACLFVATRDDAVDRLTAGGRAMLRPRRGARVSFAPVVQPGGGGGQLAVTF
jgi:hypothetical protein